MTRQELIEALCEFPYTYSREIPGGIGAVDVGAWVQVESAAGTPLLSEEEFDEIATHTDAEARLLASAMDIPYSSDPSRGSE